jgi:hypothetical protein
VIERTTDVLSVSCVGCEDLHLALGQYRCFRDDEGEGDFICWPKVGPIYPGPRAENCWRRPASSGLVEALEEIKRNCEPWKTADNMAGRLWEIADFALRKAREQS